MAAAVQLIYRSSKCWFKWRVYTVDIPWRCISYTYKENCSRLRSVSNIERMTDVIIDYYEVGQHVYMGTSLTKYRIDHSHHYIQWGRYVGVECNVFIRQRHLKTDQSNFNGGCAWLCVKSLLDFKWWIHFTVSSVHVTVCLEIEKKQEQNKTKKEKYSLSKRYSSLQF